MTPRIQASRLSQAATRTIFPASAQRVPVQSVPLFHEQTKTVMSMAFCSNTRAWRRPQLLFRVDDIGCRWLSTQREDEEEQDELTEETTAPINQSSRDNRRRSSKLETEQETEERVPLDRNQLLVEVLPDLLQGLQNADLNNVEACRATADQTDDALFSLCHYDSQNNSNVEQEKEQEQGLDSTNSTATTQRASLEEPFQRLLSAEMVSTAMHILSRCELPPQELSQRVRSWERYLGQLKWTPLTDDLSLGLLTANARAGNVGRVLSLLKLQQARGFPPRDAEFYLAVTSLKVSSISQHMGGIRNIFVHDTKQPAIDNPTRWLDAILLNMSSRNAPLTIELANHMLDCYAATGGRTGKAVHHFYRVVRQGIFSLPPEDQPQDTEEMPKEWFYNPETGKTAYQPVKVKVKYLTGSPPFYKVPSIVKGRLMPTKQNKKGQLKLEKEVEPDYSLALSAAFAFADSLQHGACGHEPIELNVGSHNALIKACVCRGALWRAIHILDHTLPERGLTPNRRSYNYLLAGLSAVGDVAMVQEYYMKMHNSNIAPDQFTVQAIVDGLINMNDLPAAITVVQDMFNQHCVLPPQNTHHKILEICLASGLLYEAKRYVYVIQQFWKWKCNQYHMDHHPAFVSKMHALQTDPSLQKEALQKLFAYFGEELRESDFLP